VVLVAELSTLFRVVRVPSPLLDDLTGPVAEGRCRCLGRWFADVDIDTDMSSCLRLEFEAEFARARATAVANLPLN
jgi:hypothetical protein